MKEGELTLKTEEKPLSGHGMLRVEKSICWSWLATIVCWDADLWSEG